jgi:hypothetical protein
VEASFQIARSTTSTSSLLRFVGCGVSDLGEVWGFAFERIGSFNSLILTSVHLAAIVAVGAAVHIVALSDIPFYYCDCNLLSTFRLESIDQSELSLRRSILSFV